MVNHPCPRLIDPSCPQPARRLRDSWEHLLPHGAIMKQNRM